MQGMWVRSLVRKLRSHKPCSQKKKKKKHLTVNFERESSVQWLCIPGDLIYLLQSKNKTNSDDIYCICIFLDLFKIPRLWSSYWIILFSQSTIWFFCSIICCCNYSRTMRDIPGIRCEHFPNQSRELKILLSLLKML